MGGADYGTVRAGAFMGLRILNHAAQQQEQRPIGAHSVKNNRLAESVEETADFDCTAQKHAPGDARNALYRSNAANMKTSVII